MTARRLLRRLVRRAITPARLWINRMAYSASMREIERLRMMRDGFERLEKIERQQATKLSIRLMSIQRGLL